MATGHATAVADVGRSVRTLVVRAGPGAGIGQTSKPVERTAVATTFTLAPDAYAGRFPATAANGPLYSRVSLRASTT